MNLYCCGCNKDVEPRLTDGKEVYPHRKDLYSIPFWKCDGCGNFVGCHHKTPERTKPLGVIPSKELKKARMRVHALIDPIWQSGRLPRGKIYAHISRLIGKPYHSAEIRTVEEADKIYEIVLELLRSISTLPSW